MKQRRNTLSIGLADMKIVLIFRNYIAQGKGFSVIVAQCHLGNVLIFVSCYDVVN